jgi:hypothetical protein
MSGTNEVSPTALRVVKLDYVMFTFPFLSARQPRVASRPSRPI